MDFYTVERTSPQTGERIQRTFTNFGRAVSFFQTAQEKGQEPTYVETPVGVKAHLANLKS